MIPGETIASGASPTKLHLQPLYFKEACAFIEEHHRHHAPQQMHLFSIGLNDGEKVVAVACVGRPVAISLNDGYTAEVTRLCTIDRNNPHAASKLYAACWRAARAMGYRRLITYTLIEEAGTSLRAAGWKELYKTRGGSWDCPSRPRVDKHPTGQKVLWEVKDETA